MKPHPTHRRKSLLPLIIGPALALLGVLTAAAGVSGCKRVPVTNRLQYNIVPEDVMIPLGANTYQQMLQGEKVVTGTSSAKTLNQVGKRIARVAKEPDYKWDYSLVKNDEVLNAWCLPGGKIAFYTGILPVLENEAGMAFVMGHEVAHATARHGAERLSQQLTLLGGLNALYIYMERGTELSSDDRELIMAALGLGAQVGLTLPFSRKHEKEADAIGLLYMARAGYPPTESVAVWDRMEAKAGGQKVPAFLSTHPPYQKRKENLRDWMPRAKKRYNRNKLDEDTLAAVWR